MPESPNEKLYTGAKLTPPEKVADSAFPYAELDVTSNFSFLRGASHPDELVYRAAELGYHALAITDVNSLAGVVRAHEAAKKIAGFRLIIGTRLVFTDGTPDLLVWPSNRDAYSRLCRLLTLGRRRAPKGECHLTLQDFLTHSEGQWTALCLPHGLSPSSPPHCPTAPLPHCLTACLPLIASLPHCLLPRLSLSLPLHLSSHDADHLSAAIDLSRRTGVPLLATNHVHYHDPSRRALQDILTCTRLGCTIHEAGHRLFPNAERYLKPPERMHRLFAACPEAIQRGIEIANACTFSLDELRYEYPTEAVPRGVAPSDHLRALTYAGARERYPNGISPKVTALLEKELAFICGSKYESYFLTVHDLVREAVSRGILCQGRGSAANSAVCYCLGVTSVDPERFQLVFERFASDARSEPPDIDVDFEHERREEIIQYVYEKYGRSHAGMTASLITYRGRSAVRDVGKALGLSADLIDQLADKLDWWHRGTVADAHLAELGVDPADPTLRRLIALTSQILGFPRHLSQHVGGLVIARAPLHDLVPIENASMTNRTVIEWDKDDLDVIGLFKVDVLGLGMLTVISKAFRYVNVGNEAMRQLGNEGNADGEDQHVSGSGGLAIGQASGDGDLPHYSQHATRGNVRHDLAGAPGGHLDTVEHRRGLRAAISAGLPEILENSPRLTCRTLDSVGDRQRPPTDTPYPPPHIAPARSGTRPPSPHQEPRTKTPPPPTSPFTLTASPPSPLIASLPNCLIAPPPPLSLFSLPPEDPATYDMISDADTVGVFQIESRAQMSMLPRLQPRKFYDLVIEVAIVRPGPIQGKMVHPYLQNRERLRADPTFEVSYPSDALREVLKETLGVPLFQEQAMRLAVVAAGFTATEADALRRAMAAWKRHGGLGHLRDKFINGMLTRGYQPDFAEKCFQQISGFGQYGFPESHAASFARLVYASAWLKRHHPAAFAAALINSQPMGFYAPAQIVRDAREHGVPIRPIDINASHHDCTLEYDAPEITPPANDVPPNDTPPTNTPPTDAPPPPHDPTPISPRLAGGRASHAEQPTSTPHPTLADSYSSPLPRASPGLTAHRSTWGHDGPALRLGFRLIKGFRKSDADRIVLARETHGPFTSVAELQRLAQLDRATIDRLARADAFASLGLSRRQASWHALALAAEPIPLTEEHDQETPAPAQLPLMPLVQEVFSDYSTTSLSLKRHPVSFARSALAKLKVTTALSLQDATRFPHGSRASVAGLVLVRQRPGTASGVVFITLEDETGTANLILWSAIYERYRLAARHATLLLADGLIQREGKVIHLLARRLTDRTDLIPGVAQKSRDFH